MANKLPSTNVASRNAPEWNDNIHDLSSMKLSKEERSKKSTSRQSHNMGIAKAELMDRNRQGLPQTFSPAVTSRLRATGNKSIEDALSDSSAALALAHKMKEEDLTQSHARQMGSLTRDTPAMGISKLRQAYSKEPDDHHLSNSASEYLDHKKMSDLSLIQKSTSSEAGMNLYPLSPQGWENLNNTIQLVVKTCEALWQQLEEERRTRERLHMQLQEQRSIITTLTAELLQIQEHQELILMELHSSRSPMGPFGGARGGGGLSDLRQHRSIPSDLLRDRAMGPPSLSERFSGRAFALSDSSIDRGKKDMLGEGHMGELSADELDMDPSPKMLMRLQGKSRSALQLNQEQENLRLNQLSAEASLIEMLQSYQLGDR